MSDGMPSIRANHQVGAHFHFATRRFCAYSDDAILLENEIDNFVLHEQPKIRKSFCVPGEEIEKIALRHEGDELAARGQLCEISNRYALTIHYGVQHAHFLMRLLQKLIQQTQLVRQLQRG